MNGSFSVFRSIIVCEINNLIALILICTSGTSRHQKSKQDRYLARSKCCTSHLDSGRKSINDALCLGFQCEWITRKIDRKNSLWVRFVRSNEKFSFVGNFNKIDPELVEISLIIIRCTLKSDDIFLSGISIAFAVIKKYRKKILHKRIKASRKQQTTVVSADEIT